MTLPILDLENSTIHGGLSITRDGVPATIEDALASGEMVAKLPPSEKARDLAAKAVGVSKDDANVILSMIARFVQNRDANHG